MNVAITFMLICVCIIVFTVACVIIAWAVKAILEWADDANDSLDNIKYTYNKRKREKETKN